MEHDSEGSLLSLDGTIRHFSRQAFVKLAPDVNRCFICGALNTVQIFNNEHVIPNWLLRRFDLHSKRITLTNKNQNQYGRYLLRCCESCNTLLGTTVETPISRIFKDEFDEVYANLRNSDTSLFYQWLCLLFIKCHIKDRDFRADVDCRNESPKLSDFYDWDGLHHIHAVARASHSDAIIDPSVVGTTLIFHMKAEGEQFDFGTISDYSTIFVRIGPVGIVSVLNDCGYVWRLVLKYLSRISGPLSAIQLREVAARLAYGNELLVSRPIFWSELDQEQSLTIRAAPPKILEIGEVDQSALVKLIDSQCRPILLRGCLRSFRQSG
jgi:hypothetical protein